jgi:hypothetical protein
MRQLLWMPLVNAGLNILMILILVVYFSPQDKRLLTTFSLLFVYLLTVIVRRKYSFSKALQRFPLFLIILFGFLFATLLFLTLGIEAMSRSIYIIFIYIGVLFWPVFGLLIAREGTFSHPLWWPFYPVIYVLTWILRMPSNTLRFFKTIKLRALIMLISFLMGCVLILYLFVRFSNVYSTIPNSVIYGFLAISGIYASWIIGKEFIFWLHDIKVWREWCKKQTMPITYETLVESLKQFKKPSFYAKTVKFIREDQRLIPDSSVVIKIRQLVQIFEKAYQVGSMVNSPNGENEQLTDELRDYEFILYWLKKFKKRDPDGIRESGPEFLDQICLLAEQIQLMCNSDKKPSTLS